MASSEFLISEPVPAPEVPFLDGTKTRVCNGVIQKKSCEPGKEVEVEKKVSDPKVIEISSEGVKISQISFQGGGITGMDILVYLDEEPKEIELFEDLALVFIEFKWKKL